MKKLFIFIFFFLFLQYMCFRNKIRKIVDYLDKPWSLSFIDKDNIIFTEKSGKLFGLNLKEKKCN